MKLFFGKQIILFTKGGSVTSQEDKNKQKKPTTKSLHWLVFIPCQMHPAAHVDLLTPRPQTSNITPGNNPV